MILRRSRLLFFFKAVLTEQIRPILHRKRYVPEEVSESKLSSKGAKKGGGGGVIPVAFLTFLRQSRQAVLFRFIRSCAF